MRRLFSAAIVAFLVAGILPVHAVAAAAVADDQAVSVVEDATTTIALTANGGDGELTFSVVDQPRRGSLTGTAPDLAYAPDPDYNGDDSFTFLVNDTFEDSNIATVTISVTPANDPPVANDDPGSACQPPALFDGSFPIPEDYVLGPMPATLPCDLGTNDTDVDGDTLMFALVTQADHGVASVGADGGWSYTPDANFFTPVLDYTSDSFTYRVSDGTAWSSPATMRLWIAPVNDAPTFTSGGDVSVGEDSGPYSAPWAASISAGPGEVDQAVTFVVHATNPSLFETAPSISPAGVLTFVPAMEWYGSSTVTVGAKDDGGLEDYGVAGVTPADTSADQVFTITVSPADDAPIPEGTSAILDEDAGPWLIAVSAADVEGDNTTAFTVATQAAHGSVEAVVGITCSPPGTCTGAFIYTPDPDYNGPDSFTFTATDGTLSSAPATVSITVVPKNDAPVCGGASPAAADEDARQSGSVSCTDADGDTLTYGLVDAAGHGIAAVAAGGAWTYTPDPDYNGPDGFTFSADDGLDASTPATLALTINPVNDRPTCSGLALATDKNAAVGGTVACTDVEGTTLSLAVSSPPVRGTVDPFETSTGAFTYTPGPDVIGPDAFEVTATDGDLVSDPVTVEISIANQAPVCADASPAAADEDTTQAGTLSCVDDDGDTLAYAKAGDPAHGSVVVDADTGAWTYAPDPDYNGGDSFTATASDGVATSAPATIALEVTAVNDVPACDPVASLGEEEVAQGGTIACTDAENDPITYAKATDPDPGMGTATVAGNGAWTYNPIPNRNGTDSFTFTAADALGASPPQVVSLTIADVNDPPDARVDGITINGTSTATLPVLAGGANGAGRDFSGPAIGSVTSEPTDTITVTSVTQGTKGYVSIAPGGTAIVYDVKGCASGGDSFRYTITDGHGLTDTADVFVTIARPGTNGLSSSPITDTPSLGFVANSTMGSTVPAKLSWCGVTRSGYSVRSYTVQQSTNGGLTFSSTLSLTSKTATSSARNLSVGTTYRWRARTTDSGGHSGAYAQSLTAGVARYQESSTAIAWVGLWSKSSTTNASGGAERYASAKGASASITLTNVRQVAIVGPRSSSRGSFEVWVDGAKVATVSEKASTTVYRRLLYVRNLTGGVGVSHTIEIRAAGNGRIDLDAVLALS